MCQAHEPTLPPESKTPNIGLRSLLLSEAHPEKLNVFTRCITDWHLSRSLEHELPVVALSRRSSVDARRPIVRHQIDTCVLYRPGENSDTSLS